MNRITSKSRDCGAMNSGLTAEDLNNHYARISMDTNYQALERKRSNNSRCVSEIHEITVFRMLDTLRPSSSGPDELPSWFLRLAAPFLAEPLTHIYNLSMGSSIVPNQWKSSVITPVPKITNPKCEADFRPISVTSILSRKLENYVVNSNLYPAMNDTYGDLIFSDQYAFRPTGSATAALIAILNDVTESLRMGKMVVMLSLDFSKAFDTVRHKFLGSLSTKKSINASVVQGSSLGPCSFSVVAADLKPQNDCFHMFKFADDMNLTTATDIIIIIIFV